MAIRYLIIAILLLATVPASADDWRREDTYREAAYLGLLAVDWGQTLDVASQCDEPGGITEGNPLLSECPSRGEVHQAIIVSAIGHYAISRALPLRYRKWWQRITVAGEATAVAHNFSIGLTIKF